MLLSIVVPKANSEDLPTALLLVLYLDKIHILQLIGVILVVKVDVVVEPS